MNIELAAVMAGILLNSALYLVGVLVASLVRGAPVAGNLALVTMGATYLCYLAQLTAYQSPTGKAREDFRIAGLIMIALSIFLGILSGLALLMGY